MLSTPPPQPMAGQYGTTTGGDGVHATITTPAWGPSLAPGGWLYQWVMMTGWWAPGCRYWVQIGPMASGGSIYVAEQAYVEPACAGGWTTYHTYATLAPNTNHRFEILNAGGDWWQVTADDQIVDRVNLPSGPTAEPQVYAEAANLNAAPDLYFDAIEAHNGGSWGPWGRCSYQADAPWSFAARIPCGYFAARW